MYCEISNVIFVYEYTVVTDYKLRLRFECIKKQIVWYTSVFRAVHNHACDYLCSAVCVIVFQGLPNVVR